MMYDDQRNWIKTLKVGDEVVLIKSSWRGSKYSIKEVEKVTPTGRVVIGGVTFLPNGTKWGGTTGYARIEPVTDEHRERIEEEKFLRYGYTLIEEVAKRNIKISKEQLKAIVEVIEREVHA